MKSLNFLLLAALPNMVNADGLVARRRGAEFNIHVRHEDDTSHQAERLSKRASCGKGTGSCPKGQCCSESGQCGTTSAYCTSPQCQMAYSNGNCDGRYVYRYDRSYTSADKPPARNQREKLQQIYPDRLLAKLHTASIEISCSALSSN
jgi:hypothetical protein